MHPPGFLRILKGADRAALVLASAVVALDDRPVLLAGRPVEQVVVDGPVAHAHLRLVRLAVEEPGGGRLFQNGSRRVQAAEKGVDFRDREIGDGIEITGPVAPLGKVAQYRIAFRLS